MAEKIIVASGKGGVGKSSFTAGVACALTDLGKRVLVIDGDIGLRSLDVMLGVANKTVYDWGDVVTGLCEPVSAIMKSRKPDLLAAPRMASNEYTPENIEWLISNYENNYDYVFFDAPAGIGEKFKLAVPACNRAIIIATPDPISVRSASIAAGHIRGLGLEDLRLVINRFQVKYSAKGALLNIDEVIDSTSVRLLGIVPEDEEVILCAAGDRELSIESSPAAKAFQRIARRLEGENVRLRLK